MDYVFFSTKLAPAFVEIKMFFKVSLIGTRVCSRGPGEGGHLRVGVVVETGAAAADGEYTAHADTMQLEDRRHKTLDNSKLIANLRSRSSRSITSGAS